MKLVEDLEVEVVMTSLDRRILDWKSSINFFRGDQTVRSVGTSCSASAVERGTRGVSMLPTDC